MIILLIVPVFVILLRINEESDCMKTFDSYSSGITAVSSIFKKKNK